ncbi:carbohydrate ABC transporter permease [Actinopolymorpha singaporensis]|uniref:Carbohydrate ABC transporter membrane protein 2, CUT1 family n=1 Tax=Actinopolymorpha singaporensis TaxID=117157 RepID=A0A1H1LSS1_9ACTN|nr:carbohydrate ABC transporter permease [Actinopolymorpha singaporensis]SDR77581.1 carbohydrate ABC transporter membrane protein 2, CUT1 family [Actinopolymorpha singaporensis]
MTSPDPSTATTATPGTARLSGPVAAGDATRTGGAPRPQVRGSGRRLVANAMTYVLLLLGAVVTLAPFLLSVLTSVRSAKQFATGGPLALPNPVTSANYAELFGGRYDFIPPLVITVQVVLVVLVGQLVFSVLAAYAFARVRFPGREGLFWVYLATLMVPQVVTLIPLYTMLSTAGLRDTFWGIVLPFVFGSPYAIFLLREYFRGIPEDVLSAAKLDGAGTLRTIWYVVVPMSRPILATLAIITVVSHWNNFLWPLIITSSTKWQVLTVATANLQSQYSGNWTLVTAATTVAMAPLLVVYLVFQRHVVRSISLTGLR